MEPGRRRVVLGGVDTVVGGNVAGLGFMESHTQSC